MGTENLISLSIVRIFFIPSLFLFLSENLIFVKVKYLKFELKLSSLKERFKLASIRGKDTIVIMEYKSTKWKKWWIQMISLSTFPHNKPSTSHHSTYPLFSETWLTLYSLSLLPTPNFTPLSKHQNWYTLFHNFTHCKWIITIFINFLQLRQCPRTRLFNGWQQVICVFY